MDSSRFTVLADNSVVEKPVVDDRQYRLVNLHDNNLSVLLIHDPTTDKAAASLDVNTGLFADREYQILGLAHFCEHLLFMGTEKYPEENEYSLYLAKHLGYSNAYTAAEHTNYYFQVSANHLQGALDRFAQFFISPLFSNSCKDREINAVDLENKKNLQNDLWRMYQLDKLNLNPEHPYNGFATGNFYTLAEEPAEKGMDVRETLIKFHKDHYLANLMSLVILGKEDLDTLTSWAFELFRDVPNKGLPRPNYNGTLIFPEEYLGKITRAVPVMDNHKLEIVFMIPEDLDDKWKLKLLAYYSHLLGHESEGLVLYYLKLKNWVSELSAGNIRVCQGNSFFILEFELTPQGLENWKTIVITVFQYLQYLQAQEPHKWIWEEISNMSKINFKFKQKTDASSTVSKLSNSLYQFTADGQIPLEYILSLLVMREFNPEQIKQYGRYLNPDNFRITLTSQALDGLDKKERWYGTEYLYEDIPSDLMTQIKSAEPISDLHLPIPNDFIPTDFTISLPKLETPLSHPYLIEDTSALQVWFKQDDRFEVPKGTIEVLLHLPMLNKNVRQATMSQLVGDLFNDELNQITYYASLVGLKVMFTFWRDGFSLKVSGYNDKLPVLFEQVIEKFIRFKPNPARFDAIKFKMTQELKNFGYHVPYSQVNTHHMLLINEKTYLYPEKLKQLESISCEDVTEFVTQQLWSEGVFCEMLIHGNFDISKAREIKQGLATQLEGRGTISGDVIGAIRLRNAILAPNEVARYEVSLEDSKNINSCIEYYIQIGADKDNDRLRVLTDLLGVIIREPCFNQLRTREQLGYVVFLGLKPCRNSFGFRVLIQSERTTDYLEYRIDEFLHQFGRHVSSMENEEFEKFKQALEDLKLTKLKHLSEETLRFWNSITDGYYNFDARKRHVEVLESITKAEFIQFYQDYVLNRAGKLARLAVHLKAQHPLKVSRDKLINLSLINWMFRNDIDVDLDKIDDILKKSTNVQEIAKKVAALLRADNLEHSTDDIAAIIESGLVQPVPATYPTGKLYTNIPSFREDHDMSEHAKPVEPLKNFYIPDLSHL